MIKALQSSAQALWVQARRHELIANNLANANTPGYQRQIARVRSTMNAAAGSAAAGPPANLTVESLTLEASGPIQSTGNPLDLALMGPGYFLVETPDGDCLSRDGGFSLGQEGQLLHSSGHPVQADGGELVLRGQVSVLRDGSVLEDGRLVGRLAVVRPAEGATMIRRGDNLFELQGEYEEINPEEISVVAGHLEGSNVEAIEEMVDMIRAFRAYEIAQKAAHAADETLRTAVERVGVLRA